jgi:signal transduction histidine kinase
MAAARKRTVCVRVPVQSRLVRDAPHLRQILSNLLRNAFELTERGGVTFE